jgi:uncharacterized membrane protein YagU involved in acid resistance
MVAVSCIDGLVLLHSLASVIICYFFCNFIAWCGSFLALALALALGVRFTDTLFLLLPIFFAFRINTQPLLESTTVSRLLGHVAFLINLKCIRLCLRLRNSGV